ncbi:MAG: AAA family ATPase [Nitrospirota bacterium]|nr:AAA family ATPase [Nitrospirota bacterium]
MIKTLKINRFKLFESLRIDNFSQITLIGGKNNVGKTSLLESIFTFYDRGNPEVTFRQFAWRGVKTVALTSEAMWAPIFKDFDMSMPIDIEVNNTKKRERLRIRLNSKYQKKLQVRKSFTPGSPKQISTDQLASPIVALDFVYYVGDKEKGSAHILLDQGGLGIEIENLASSKTAVIFPSCRDKNPNEDAERFGKIDIEGRLNELTGLIKIVEPRLISLSSIAQINYSLIHGDIGLSRKIPIPYMGEGISKLLSYILAIMTTENGIVLIDEIENGLHYSVLPEIWKAIFKAAKISNCQVVITTHSYEAIKAMQEAMKGNESSFSYIRLDRAGNEIVPQYYNPDMLISAFESNWEVR